MVVQAKPRRSGDTIVEHSQLFVIGGAGTGEIGNNVSAGGSGEDIGDRVGCPNVWIWDRKSLRYLGAAR